MLGNMLGINYKEIFQQVIKDKNVQQGLADFMVYCFDNCIELEDTIVEKFETNPKLVSIIDKRILELANQSETKSKFTRQIKEGV